MIVVINGSEKYLRHAYVEKALVGMGYTNVKVSPHKTNHGQISRHEIHDFPVDRELDKDLMGALIAEAIEASPGSITVVIEEVFL